MEFLSDRIRAKIEVVDGCWLWTASLNKQGYAYLWDTKTWIGHKWAWAQVHEPAPSNMHLHHTCGQRRCINPDHLELLSTGEHRQRHMSTECCNGHEYTEANMYVDPRGWRGCRRCRRKARWEHETKQKPR